MTKFFDSDFFHQITSPSAVRHAQKGFLKNFFKIFLELFQFVIDSQLVFVIDSPVYSPPGVETPWCHKHCGVVTPRCIHHWGNTYIEELT